MCSGARIPKRPFDWFDKRSVSRSMRATIRHGDEALSARALDSQHVLSIGVTGGTFLSKDKNSRLLVAAHAHADERVARDLRAIIERYKVREVQTFSFQQRLLDQASTRAETAETRVLALEAELAAVPAHVQAAVLETRTRLVKEMEALSTGVALRDHELARLSHHAEEISAIKSKLTTVEAALAREQRARAEDGLEMQRRMAKAIATMRASVMEQESKGRALVLSRTESLLDASTREVIHINAILTEELGFAHSQSARLDARCERLVADVAALRRELSLATQANDELLVRAAQTRTHSSPSSEVHAPRLGALAAKLSSAMQPLAMQAALRPWHRQEQGAPACPGAAASEPSVVNYAFPADPWKTYSPSAFHKLAVKPLPAARVVAPAQQGSSASLRARLVISEASVDAAVGLLVHLEDSNAPLASRALTAGCAALRALLPLYPGHREADCDVLGWLRTVRSSIAGGDITRLKSSPDDAQCIDAGVLLASLDELCSVAAYLAETAATPIVPPHHSSQHQAIMATLSDRIDAISAATRWRRMIHDDAHTLLAAQRFHVLGPAAPKSQGDFYDDAAQDSTPTTLEVLSSLARAAQHKPRSSVDQLGDSSEILLTQPRHSGLSTLFPSNLELQSPSGLGVSFGINGVVTHRMSGHARQGHLIPRASHNNLQSPPRLDSTPIRVGSYSRAEVPTDSEHCNFTAAASLSALSNAEANSQSAETGDAHLVTGSQIAVRRTSRAYAPSAAALETLAAHGAALVVHATPSSHNHPFVAAHRPSDMGVHDGIHQPAHEMPNCGRVQNRDTTERGLREASSEHAQVEETRASGLPSSSAGNGSESALNRPDSAKQSCDSGYTGSEGSESESARGPCKWRSPPHRARISDSQEILGRRASGRLHPLPNTPPHLIPSARATAAPDRFAADVVARNAADFARAVAAESVRDLRSHVGRHAAGSSGES